MGERILKIPKNCPFESQKYKNRVWRVEPQRILKIPKNCPFESQKYKNRVWRVEPQVDVRDGLKNPNITSIARNRFQVKVQRTEFQAQVWRDEL